MKKKIIGITMFCCLVIMGAVSSSMASYDPPGLPGDDNVVWGTGKQYWWNGWNLCCDKSDKDAPCRQSTSSCP